MAAFDPSTYIHGLSLAQDGFITQSQFLAQQFDRIGQMGMALGEERRQNDLKKSGLAQDHARILLEKQRVNHDAVRLENEKSNLAINWADLGNRRLQAEMQRKHEAEQGKLDRKERSETAVMMQRHADARQESSEAAAFETWYTAAAANGTINTSIPLRGTDDASRKAWLDANNKYNSTIDGVAGRFVYGLANGGAVPTQQHVGQEASRIASELNLGQEAIPQLVNHMNTRVAISAIGKAGTALGTAGPVITELWQKIPTSVNHSAGVIDFNLAISEKLTPEVMNQMETLRSLVNTGAPLLSSDPELISTARNTLKLYDSVLTAQGSYLMRNGDRNSSYGGSGNLGTRPVAGNARGK